MSAPLRIAVSASFTAEPLAPVLAFWGEQLHVGLEVHFAPYQQVLQTLLDPVGVFAQNIGGINVVLVRLGDFGGQAGEVAEAVRTASGRDQAPLLLVICPGIEGSRAAEEQLLAALPGNVLDSRWIHHLYPVDAVFDATADRLGAIPYTGEFFAALGTGIARRISSLLQPPYKAIALDCDNTLWEGVCGEDGPGGVRLDAGRQALQEFLLKQRAAGMLLCLASKNNPDDVMETFSRHLEMPLQLRHFTATRLNWEPKPGNLFSLAEELSLATDSFLFLDDSALECAEMREERPEVATLQLPASGAGFLQFLEHVWAFDHAVVTDEDVQRAARYEQSREFGAAIQKALSLEDFMASLQLHVRLETAREADVPRVAQLTQRTNQFNTTGVKYSEAQVLGLVKLRRVFTVRVSDRFGDYGLTGAAICAFPENGLTVESLLLSCRVLGRGVEHRVLASLAAMADGFVEINVSETGRNAPALDFLRALGADTTNGSARFAASDLRELKWKPAPGGTAPRAPSVSLRRYCFPYERIARDLATVPQILAAMRGQATPGEVLRDGNATPTERDLAAIWADLLGLKSVAREDRFFERGGHSLLAVLLISRARERFGVELGIDDVYSAGQTLRDQAAKIDALREGGVNADEYEAMMAEIALLSDEEVRQLLGPE